MNIIQTPSEFDVVETGQILAANQNSVFVSRIASISEHFLGRPYVEGSLGGGPDLQEELRVTLAAFDCVTYIEIVLALSVARTIDEFVDAIRLIRYRDGRIDWVTRNHYMVDWARNNEAQGFLTDLTVGPLTTNKECTLNLIPGLPTISAMVRYFPNQTLDSVLELIQTGDLIFFVSAKTTLDVFHTGLLIRREKTTLMRHATRTAGAVIEQPLNDFIEKNSMAGVILLRPLCRR